MGFWGRRAVGVAIAAVSVLALSSGAAGAADPPGTVEVNRVPTQDPGIEVVGASSYGVLYTAGPRDIFSGRKVTWLKPAGRPAYEISNDFRVLRGDKVYAEGGRYLVIGRTQVQTCDPDLAPLPVWSWADAAYTSFGWIGTGGRRIHVSAAGCEVGGTGPEILDYKLMAADDQGYVLRGGTDDELVELEYHSYADPGTAVRIQDGGRNRSPRAIDLKGDQVSWASYDESDPVPHASYVVRSSTTGGPARVTRVERVVRQTAINGVGTGWAGCDESIAEDRCAAGSISASGAVTEVKGSETIGVHGQRYVVDVYGRSPGLDAMAVVGDGLPRTRLVTIGLLPPKSFGVSLGGGFVAYQDNQGTRDQALHRRRVVETSGRLVLGPQRSAGEVAPVGAGQGTAGTAYVEPVPGGDLWLWRSDGTRTRVYELASGSEKVIGPLQFSGNRLLWIKALLTDQMCGPWGCEPIYDDHRMMVYDVRTGTNTEIGPLDLYRSVALAGDRLVYTDSAWRILQRDLRTGTVSELRGPGPKVADLDLEGSVLGYATCTTNQSGGCADTTLVVRDLATTSAPVERAAAGVVAVQLSAGRLVYSTSTESGSESELHVWRPGSPGGHSTIGALAGGFDAADGQVAWVGPDELVRLAPLPR
ncbi:hypothetical protein [Kribbella italica]|uniref:Uncharacterized protein n=1 Tax=Kribbella italica TaxID=1540520 RepID=A0A7W9JG96_9ACTN|nr:hypothetical protein [Kribbella italica]MBB5841270.1 hypothetical protein [Kribbella italica]